MADHPASWLQEYVQAWEEANPDTAPPVRQTDAEAAAVAEPAEQLPQPEAEEAAGGAAEAAGGEQAQPEAADGAEPGDEGGDEAGAAGGRAEPEEGGTE
jgi:hypothetical protein